MDFGLIYYVSSVKFQITAAQAIVAIQNWAGLEFYLNEFLTEVQGEKFFPHPGLFCSLFQAHISYLIGEGKFVEARCVFDDKVKPLLDEDNDDLYKPFDLEVRVQMLQNCVNDCLPPSADEVEDMNVVLSDYLMLYFPTSLQSDANRTNSVSAFLTTFCDEKGKRHRCLACQRDMSEATSSSLVHHIKHRCRRVAKWMLEYLAYVDGEKEIDIHDLTAGSSGSQSRKRKAPLSPMHAVPEQKSVVIPVTHALKIWNDLSSTNMLALFALMNDESQSAAEAKKILFHHEEFGLELKSLFLSSLLKGVPLGSPLAFLKIKTLLNLSDDLFTLLKNLPDVSKLLLEQDKKANELRRCFMVAAAKCRPPTALDVMSGTGSSESIASRVP
ncbi:hypothetical protein HU200_054239 [Digitaria exilis]|uniref:Uncharacterized protein n=1 Tax=Digitaria exilis TaxID=1010633 RepID=A0A835AL76_9POAL|nr:hypothetical protein HU200_054239 [Digitaria exilis]